MIHSSLKIALEILLLGKSCLETCAGLHLSCRLVMGRPPHAPSLGRWQHTERETPKPEATPAWESSSHGTSKSAAGGSAEGKRKEPAAVSSSWLLCVPPLPQDPRQHHTLDSGSARVSVREQKLADVQSETLRSTQGRKKDAWHCLKVRGT